MGRLQEGVQLGSEVRGAGVALGRVFHQTNELVFVGHGSSSCRLSFGGTDQHQSGHAYRDAFEGFQFAKEHGKGNEYNHRVLEAFFVGAKTSGTSAC